MASKFFELTRAGLIVQIKVIFRFMSGLNIGGHKTQTSLIAFGKQTAEQKRRTPKEPFPSVN